MKGTIIEGGWDYTDEEMDDMMIRRNQLRRQPNPLQEEEVKETNDLEINDEEKETDIIDEMLKAED